MDPRAQGIVNQVSSLTGEFGLSITIMRSVKSTSQTQQDAFGQPINPSPPQQIQTNVIIESQKINYEPTLVGGRPKQELKMIANTGVFLEGDELTFSGHTYKVEFREPVNFTGSNVVDFVHATREVD